MHFQSFSFTALHIMLAFTRTVAWTSRSVFLERTISSRAFVRLSPSHVLRTHHDRPHVALLTRFSTQGDGDSGTDFQPGDKIQVEVISFGPLGASVDVIADSHDPESVIPETEPPLGEGLILQKEIQYFRQARNNVDVVRGEILPAYVERVHEETGKINVGLRVFGGKAKAQEVGDMIMERLEQEPGGTLPIGDKSSPKEIAAEFPGVSKSSFKRAVSALYKQGKVQPSPNSIILM